MGADQIGTMVTPQMLVRADERVKRLEADLEIAKKERDAYRFVLSLSTGNGHQLPSNLTVTPRAGMVSAHTQPPLIEVAPSSPTAPSVHVTPTLPARVEQLILSAGKPLMAAEMRRTLIAEKFPSQRIRDSAAFYNALTRLVNHDRLIKEGQKYRLGPRTLATSPHASTEIVKAPQKSKAGRNSRTHWERVLEILELHKRPMEIQEITVFGNSHWQLDWTSRLVKLQLKRKRTVFEILRDGCYALRAWPEEVKTGYRGRISPSFGTQPKASNP